MNGILLAGLTDHEAAAIEILIGMHWRAQRSVILPRSLSLAIPEQGAAARACGSCVIDLFGLGMRKHSAAREAELLAFLAGRSAVLLTWGDGGGWLDRGLRTAPGRVVPTALRPDCPAAGRACHGGVGEPVHQSR